MKHPTISVIIPVFNEEKRIRKCLSSISNQNYPQEKIEIIVIDDKSTDNTARWAKKLGAKIVTSGQKNIEKAKSLGLRKSKGKYVFFMDADNLLTKDTWFSDCIEIFADHKDLVGIQSFRYLYNKSDKAINRYCQLFGINDPLVYYLGKRGQLNATESNWIYPKTLVANKRKYYLVRFTKDSLPTMGSQGYMTKRRLLLQTKWKPYLFHMDSIHDLVDMGNTLFAFVKYDIQHDYVVTFSGQLAKWKRNIDLYLKQSDLRRYKYDMNKNKLFMAILTMLTLVVPLIDSIKGYLKKPDMAWFLHPFMCILVIFVYTYSVTIHYLKKLITI